MLCILYLLLQLIQQSLLFALRLLLFEELFLEVVGLVAEHLVFVVELEQLAMVQLLLCEVLRRVLHLLGDFEFGLLLLAS